MVTAKSGKAPPGEETTPFKYNAKYRSQWVPAAMPALPPAVQTAEPMAVTIAARQRATGTHVPILGVVKPSGRALVFQFHPRIKRRIHIQTTEPAIFRLVHVALVSHLYHSIAGHS